MGCDIHPRAEVRRNGQWEIVGDIFPYDDWARSYHKCDYTNEPFYWRDYGMFGFLAGVRNYSAIPPISEPRGFPVDLSPELRALTDLNIWDGHSASWLSLADLFAVDYDTSIEDRRCTVQTGPNSFNGGATCEPGQGEQTTLREFLGSLFFQHLDVLNGLGSPGNVRVVFWFDN